MVGCTRPATNQKARYRYSRCTYSIIFYFLRLPKGSIHTSWLATRSSELLNGKEKSNIVSPYFYIGLSRSVLLLCNTMGQVFCAQKEEICARLACPDLLSGQCTRSIDCTLSSLKSKLAKSCSIISVDLKCLTWKDTVYSWEISRENKGCSCSRSARVCLMLKSIGFDCFECFALLGLVGFFRVQFKVTFCVCSTCGGWGRTTLMHRRR